MDNNTQKPIIKINIEGPASPHTIFISQTPNGKFFTNGTTEIKNPKTFIRGLRQKGVTGKVTSLTKDGQRLLNGFRKKFSLQKGGKK